MGLESERNLKITASSVSSYRQMERVKDRSIGHMRLKRMYKHFPSYNINMLSDMNAKLGKECLAMSEVPALMAVLVVLVLGLTY